ncbi:hypothetical protein OS128_04420 [Corynebacterium sp. P5848]|uniref:hypothetical protein n=1 Tax=Corynebacterium marambiense TaxID=2765364 RepID=UPI002260841C|nr:hypothetical protein [Corynebacterium marambiense]MCX7542162.1 hypothetical protein [Corynebacterium marambiense]
MSDLPDLHAVIGQNVRRLRADHTMDELALEVRGLGIRWASGNVAAAESGRLKVSLPNLIILCEALGRLLDRHVPLMEMFKADGQYLLGIGELVTDEQRMKKFFEGGPPPLAHHPDAIKRINEDIRSGNFAKRFKLIVRDIPNDTPIEVLAHLEKEPVSFTEERQAKKLGTHPVALKFWSHHLWGKPFEKERDSRAGEGASPQLKGGRAREMKNELAARIEETRAANDRLGESSSNGEG